jgi:hypothetical protein
MKEITIRNKAFIYTKSEMEAALLLQISSFNDFYSINRAGDYIIELAERIKNERQHAILETVVNTR